MIKSWIYSIFFIFCTFLSFSATLTWEGDFDDDWHKDCNWNTGNIPTCSDIVIIPNVATVYPVVTGNACCSTLNITSSASTALTINSSGGAVLQLGGAIALTDNSGGGCCVISTAVTGLSYAPDPTGAATSVTITTSGGSLGTNAKYYLQLANCGSTVAFNTTGVFVVSTNSASVCPSRIYSVDILGGTCDPNIACSPNLTVCATTGTVCSSGSFSCDNSFGPNPPQCKQTVWTANGSCGQSSSTSYSDFFKCSTNPTGTNTACGCCCGTQAVFGQSSTCLNTTDERTDYTVTTAGYAYVRTISAPGCTIPSATYQWVNTGTYSVTVYDQCGAFCLSACCSGTDPSNCSNCSQSWGYDSRVGTSLSNC